MRLDMIPKAGSYGKPGKFKLLVPPAVDGRVRVLIVNVLIVLPLKYTGKSTFNKEEVITYCLIPFREYGIEEEMEEMNEYAVIYFARYNYTRKYTS